MPDGACDETASNCFYMWRDDSRYLSLFFSKHEKPQTIFIPEYENHPNTVIDVTRLVYMSAKPDNDIDYFSRAFASSPDSINADGFTMRGQCGDLTEVLTPAAATLKYGKYISSSDPDPLAGFAVALHFTVRNPDQCRRSLMDSGVSFDDWGNGIIVPASEACGCALIFEQVKHD